MELRDKLADIIRIAGERKRHVLPGGQTVSSGENVIVRPVGDVTFVRLDDLSAEQLKRVKPTAFLIHATSPGNHQAWIAADAGKSDAKDLRRPVRNAVEDADKSASAATRIAGSSNLKRSMRRNTP